MGALGNLTSGSALPPMSGFDANAVAKALGATGNAPSGVTPGVPERMVNPLAQMLAAQGPAYRPPDTTWGIAGDRLRRFTPQEGLGGGTGGRGGPSGGGAGGLPPINAGEDSMAYMLRIGMSQADADRALAMSKANPGMSFQDIMASMGGGAGGGGNTPPNSVVGPGGPVSIDWSKIEAMTKPPPTAPPGAPAINTAMEKLQTAPIAGERPPQSVLDQAVIDTRAAWRAAMQQPEGFRSLSKAEKDAWVARVGEAERAYIQAQKASGYGPGGDPYSPFAGGQVGALYDPTNPR